MVTETARVVDLENEFAWIETQRKAACHSCAARNGCGSGVLAKVLGNRRARIKVLNTLGARIGDEVVVGMDDKVLVRTSLAVYAMPLLLMMAAALAGELLGDSLQWTYTEGFSAVSGLAGLVGGFLWLRRYSALITRDQRYQPNLLRIASTVPVEPSVGELRRNGPDDRD